MLQRLVDAAVAKGLPAGDFTIGSKHFVILEAINLRVQGQGPLHTAARRSGSTQAQALRS